MKHRYLVYDIIKSPPGLIALEATKKAKHDMYAAAYGGANPLADFDFAKLELAALAPPKKIKIPKPKVGNMEIQPVWRSVYRHCTQAKTQKIRGFHAASRVAHASHNLHFGHTCNWYFAAAADVIKRDGESRSRLFSFPTFLRPCPVRPRHGFVDSRVVDTWEELLAVAHEAYEADKDAELIACPKFAASNSSVLTPSSFSYGKGHDGATSGQSETVYGPSPSVDQLDGITDLASITAGDIPFVEIIHDKHGDSYLVQVRGGPEIGAASNYVPADITVAHVVTATHDIDLLVWEKEIANAKPGTVVYAPGLSLAAHQCVHAVVNQVPVITDGKAPKVGDKLIASGAPVWTHKDWSRLARTVGEADQLFASSYEHRARLGYDWAMLGVTGLHCAGFPAPATAPQQRLLAYGVVSALKHMAAACFGEARHANRPSAVHSVNTEAGRRGERVVNVLRSLGESPSRGCIYDQTRFASIEALQWGLLALSPVYRDQRWRKGYGGNAWANINAGARKLAIALSKFQRKPSAETWAIVVGAWNEAIHREHNGKAPALSKFNVSPTEMSRTAEWPMAQLVSCNTATLNNLMEGPSPNVVLNGRTKQVHAAPKLNGEELSKVVRMNVCKDNRARVYCYPEGSNNWFSATDVNLAKGIVLQSRSDKQLVKAKVFGQAARRPADINRAIRTLSTILGIELESKFILVGNIEISKVHLPKFGAVYISDETAATIAKGVFS